MIEKIPPADDQSAIILIHGTFSDEEGPEDNKKWWQSNSEFAFQLQKSLDANGIRSDIFTEKWSGANSDLEREKGARKLAKSIQKLKKEYKHIQLVCHSHGGNVALMALELCASSIISDSSRIVGLTTIGTPFFNRGLSKRIRLNLIIFLFVSMIGIPLWAWGLFQNLQKQVEHTAGFYIGLGLASILVLFPLILMMGTALQAILRFGELNFGKFDNIRALAIWHDEDEAIALLRELQSFEHNAVAKGALFRATAISAIVVALEVVLLVSILWLSLLLAGRLGWEVPSWLGGQFTESLGASQELLFSLLPIVSTLFVTTYLCWRLLLGVLPELFRNKINLRFSNLLRNFAYGKDGIQSLKTVTTTPSQLNSRSIVISGELAESMKETAKENTAVLFERYRSDIFSLRAQSGMAPAALMADEATWGSLIHTTYFDYPELVTIITSHIQEVAIEARI